MAQHSFHLSTTDQALHRQMAEPTDVKAKEQYDKKENPKTGQMEDQLVSKDGVNINKSTAPYIETSGPLGHKYTELLNQALATTHENMNTIVAAANEASEQDASTLTTPTGYVAVHKEGNRPEMAGDPRGYLYVASGDLSRRDMMSAIDYLAKVKHEHPDANVGLVVDGDVSLTAESLMTHAGRMRVPMAISKQGAIDLARKLIVR